MMNVDDHDDGAPMPPRPRAAEGSSAVTADRLGLGCSWGDDVMFGVSSLANLAAGYNLAIAGQVLFLVNRGEQHVNESQFSLLASAAFAGAILGQLVMGWVGSRIGVVKGLVATFVLLCVGSILGATVCWGSTLVKLLAISRLIVGFGAGGVYPLAAIASAESSKSAEFDGRRVMLAFSFQVVGQLLAPAVVLALDLLMPQREKLAWRLALFFGSVPAGFAIGLVARLPVAEKTTNSIVSTHAGQTSAYWTYGNLVRLIGTGGSWFWFDVQFYGALTFQPFVLELVLGTKSPVQIAGLSVVAGVIALCGLYLASYVSDSWGRKRIQLIGFAVTGGVFFLLAGMLRAGPGNQSALIFVLYCLTFFFFNFGPNATTYCLPAETFSAETRTFFHGISAACGKLGALVGAAMFKVVLDETSIAIVMLLMSAISAIAIVVTVFFVKGPESQGNETFRPEENFPNVETESLFSREEPSIELSRY